MTDPAFAHRTRSDRPNRPEVAPRATQSTDPVLVDPLEPAWPPGPTIGARVVISEGTTHMFTGEGWIKAPHPATATPEDWADFWAEQDPDMHPYDNIERGTE